MSILDAVFIFTVSIISLILIIYATLVVAGIFWCASSKDGFNTGRLICKKCGRNYVGWQDDFNFSSSDTCSTRCEKEYLYDCAIKDEKRRKSELKKFRDRNLSI